MSARVDVLAQEIRSVDGSHSMGAGRLAEALMPFIDREFVSRAAVAELIEAARECMDCDLAGIVCVGSMAPAEHALGKLQAALARIDGAA